MERFRERLSGFFATPTGQAAGWSALGVLGLLLALGGLLLFLGGNGDSDGGQARARDDASIPATATATAKTQAPTATPSPTPSPTPTETPSPTPTATPTLISNQSGSTGGGSSAPPPTAEPTPPPPAAGGPYCNNSSSTAPPNTIAGQLTIGGQLAPVGTVVSIAFDGVVGPGRPTVAAGGYRIDWSAGGEDCANRFGAAISIVVNGQAFASPYSVGSTGGSPFIRFDIAVP
ncbi:MAG: hypothetical protein L6Q80_01630 [Dehalococcoidia bacterium]|nr:hypothetical protein [Dehalococcoidia bacterium]